MIYLIMYDAIRRSPSKCIYECRGVECCALDN